MQGVRVGRRSKIQTVRLSLDVIKRAGAVDVRRLVATRMGLDAEKASVTDVLREAVTLGVAVLEDEARGLGRSVDTKGRTKQADPELEVFEREVMPVIRAQIAASLGRLRKRKQ